MSSGLVKTPVYQQLNVILRDLIRSGEVRPGAQFLTEREICQRYGVSRATANKALSNLVAEGVLEFRKGIGTFVRSGMLQYDTKALVSFTDRAVAAGMTPETLLLAFDRPTLAQIPEAVAAALHARADGDLYYIERLRLADDMPVILEYRYIVAAACPGLTQADLEGSLYAVWTERFGLEIGGAEETIRAVNLRGSSARLLRVARGAAGFLLLSVGSLASGEPLWWEQTWYRGDLYEFRNRSGPVQASHPATGVLRSRA